MSNINDLIARLEKAAGAARELDAEIESANGGLAAWQPRGLRRWGSDTRRWECLPAYTASLDAAMTLVPDGWKASVCTEGSAAVWRRWKDDARVTVAATPALALCIAALRARQEDARDA